MMISKYGYTSEGLEYDISHGSPYDRGAADCYYGRPINPHWWPEGTNHGKEVVDLTADEKEAYLAGYAWQKMSGEVNEP